MKVVCIHRIVLQAFALGLLGELVESCTVSVTGLKINVVCTPSLMNKIISSTSTSLLTKLTHPPLII